MERQVGAWQESGLRRAWYPWIARRGMHTFERHPSVSLWSEQPITSHIPDIEFNRAGDAPSLVEEGVIRGVVPERRIEQMVSDGLI